jgi:membrane-bound ClpP family serine protease
MSETEIETFQEYRDESLREILNQCLEMARERGKDESVAYKVFRETAKTDIVDVTEEEVSKVIAEYESKK